MKVPACLLVIILSVVAVAAGAQEAVPSAAELAAAIDTLGSFEFEVRTNAARTVRRTPSGVAAPALIRAVREHADEYVRYRALVLLAGMGDATAAPVMRAAVTDRNDRMRTVAFGWFEHHPDAELLPTLLEALETEASEFVRPALTRAVAALGTDPRAQAALRPLVMRGEDFYRGTVIAALGEHRGYFALDAIREVARLDGPLQDDAITALGRLEDEEALPLLAELQKRVPQELQPTLSAALCLLGRNCEGHATFVHDALAYAATTEGFQPLLRGAVHASEMLALAGRDDSLARLFEVGLSSGETARAPIALGIGLVALKSPQATLRVLERVGDQEQAILLLRDAFDMLSEDFEEERFFVEIRRVYWDSPEGSARRRLADALIRILEF